MTAVSGNGATPIPLPPMPRIGALPSGRRDAITDVPGVTVGHATLDDGDAVHTGVTVVRPHVGDPFRQRVPAGVDVVNGFGKSVGLLQVKELGVLETPIALTNTFSVPAVAAAQIRQCIVDNPASGREQPTVNALVFECNDGFLNDIQRMAVTEADYQHAWQAASVDMASGAVGAGRGMSCCGLKGGIGTSSRSVVLPDGRSFIVGTLVLANFGRLADLRLDGQAVGGLLAASGPARIAEPEKGSIIMLLATDAPLESRQLCRLAHRAGAGLSRTGSVYGHGSGDIALAFSTAYTVPQDPFEPMPVVQWLPDAWLDDLFHAAADAIEQAIIRALWSAESFRGRGGHLRETLPSALIRAGWA